MERTCDAAKGVQDQASAGDQLGFEGVAVAFAAVKLLALLVLGL